jgi:hypothetical protein
MTFRSAILDKRVRISSWMPSAKYAFALSSLKFSNGRTAMLFSGAGAKFAALRAPDSDALNATGSFASSTSFSNRGSPRSGSQSGSSFSWP